MFGHFKDSWFVDKCLLIAQIACQADVIIVDFMSAYVLLQANNKISHNSPVDG